MMKRIFSLALVAFVAAILVRPTFAAEPAAAAGKIYELRLYTATAGRLPDLQGVFRSQGTRLLAKHGIENIFAGTVLEGAQADGADAANLLVFIVAHANREAADRAWAAFEADPEWQAAWRTGETAGPLLAKPPVSTFMVATDFSPALEAASAAGSPGRVFELRKYNTGAAGLSYTVQRFKLGMAAILVKAGMNPLAFWTAADDNAFVYLVAHKDREAARTAWANFLPDYRTFMTDYPKRADAVPAAPRTPEDNRFLVPVDFSPRR